VGPQVKKKIPSTFKPDHNVEATSDRSDQDKKGKPTQNNYKNNKKKNIAKTTNGKNRS